MKSRAHSVLIFFVLLASFFIQPIYPDYGEAGESFFADRNRSYDRERAWYYYTRAWKENPEHEYAAHQLARVAFLDGKFETAQKYIEEHIRVHGDTYPSAYYVKGLIHGYAGNYTEGIRSFKHYLNLRPNHWAGYNDLAWLYFLQGDLDNAKKYLEEGIIIAPMNAWLLASYGAVLLNTGETSEAKEVLHLAYEATLALTQAEWSRANPGNDPKVAQKGIEAMLSTIAGNIALLETES